MSPASSPDFFAGLFRIGGGGVIVPVLFEAFRVFSVPEYVRMQLCVGTSLAIIVPNTIRSYLAHRAKGFILAGVVRLWTLPAMVGVAAGAVIPAFAPVGVFKFAFALIASVIATKLLIGRESWKLGSDLSGRVATRGYGFAVGLASSLYERRRWATLLDVVVHEKIAIERRIGVVLCCEQF